MRHKNPVSRELTMGKDAEIIKNYSRPAYVLGGWEPELEKGFLSYLENGKN